MKLAHWLCNNGMAVSTTEGRRLVAGGAVRVNGVATTEMENILCLEQGDTVQVGKYKKMVVETGGQYIEDHR